MKLSNIVHDFVGSSFRLRGIRLQRRINSYDINNCFQYLSTQRITDILPFQLANKNKSKKRKRRERKEKKEKEKRKKSTMRMIKKKETSRDITCTN